jgi:hypothetical protein
MYSEGKLSDSKAIDEVKKVLTNHVKKQPEFAWMNQLSSRVYQNALSCCAFNYTVNFYTIIVGRAGEPVSVFNLEA